MAKHWIQGAIKHKGALTKKASAAGESPMEFAHSHAGASGTTGKQARLAITLSKMHKHSMHGSGQYDKGDLAKGYHCITAPEFKPAWDSKFQGNAAAQKVKGAKGSKAPAESSPAAGRSF